MIGQDKMYHDYLIRTDIKSVLRIGIRRRDGEPHEGKIDVSDNKKRRASELKRMPGKVLY